MIIHFSISGTDAIVGGESSVSLNSFECDSVQIKLESGQCHLKSIQVDTFELI